MHASAGPKTHRERAYLVLVHLLQHVRRQETPGTKMLLLEQVLKVLVQLVRDGEQVEGVLLQRQARLILACHPLEVALRGSTACSQQKVDASGQGVRAWLPVKTRNRGTRWSPSPCRPLTVSLPR
jgi:hypothetical protein